MAPAGALAYIHRHRARFLGELKEFVRFPTVSAQPRHAADMQRCASWLAAHLRGIGLEHASVVKTRLHPLVYAESRREPGRQTVLIYGHYDVQPPDPLKEWRSPPFDPVVSGGNLPAERLQPRPQWEPFEWDPCEPFGHPPPPRGPRPPA